MPAEKLLTCVVPCYNSAAYMEKAVDSLLAGGEEMDILIVNDGSTDETGAIADRLAEEHPSVVRVHHQENGGHGSALNYGMAHAKGIYFKVLDSDDRLSKEHLPGLMELLRQHSAPENQADLVFHDYVYDWTEKENVFRISYFGQVKAGQLRTWDQSRRFHIWNQFVIHSLIYRTQILQDMHYTLPEHTFYEDNLYVYQPMAHTRRILYYHAPLYGYYVRRSDQSVNEQNTMKRMDQLMKVATMQATTYRMEELNRLPKHLRGYMINNCCGQLFNICALQFIEDSERSHRMNRELWQTIRDFDPELYRRIRRNPLGRVTCLPGRAGERFLVFLYRFGRKMIRL
ncbi:MAG: glycosyltransferase [Clostridia bacterium]|nr:glycosyltransferase [Clostridia bacterium]